MNNIVEPISKEEKDRLSDLGLKPYQPRAIPSFADPDKPAYHITNALILGLSFYGRWYAPKIGVTRTPFTLSILLVPCFYFLAINRKEKRFTYDATARRSFEENLEFYPITRRAWNRAVAIRKAEI